MSLFKEKKNAGEMAQLACKHEDQSLDPQNSCENQSLKALQSAGLEYSREQEKPCVKHKLEGKGQPLGCPWTSKHP